MRIAALLPGILSLASMAGATTTISFDQLQIGEDVLNYYNGGMGSLGSGPGPSLGVVFSSGWIVGTPDVYGAPNGKSVALGSLFNVPAGWSGLVSFYYVGSPLTVSFYDQQNGTGNLVGTLNFPQEASFFPDGASLPLFRSAVFSGSGRIDALTNGSAVIPEPATLLLCVSGLAGLIGWSRRRNTRHH